MTLHQARHGATLILTMDDPGRRNALTLDLRAELDGALAAAMADRTVRVIVLTGAGGQFSAGGDVSSMQGLDGPSGRERMRRAQSIVRRIVQGEKPVISAVEGHAAGAGLCLAAACDIVVAGEGARFTCSFGRIGLAPDLGAAWTLPARMGLGRARLLMLRGAPLEAKEAERQGLVDLLSPKGEALATALDLADELARAAPLSQGFTKALLARGVPDLEAVLAAEADAQGLLYTTADFAEGRDAFLAKRPPVFQGR